MTLLQAEFKKQQDERVKNVVSSEVSFERFATEYSLGGEVGMVIDGLTL